MSVSDLGSRVEGSRVACFARKVYLGLGLIGLSPYFEGFGSVDDTLQPEAADAVLIAR